MEIGAARRRVHPAGRVAILFLQFYLARRDILACFAGKSRARGSRIEKIARALASTVRSRLAVPFDESATYEGNAGDLLDITRRKCYRVAPPSPPPLRKRKCVCFTRRRRRTLRARPLIPKFGGACIIPSLPDDPRDWIPRTSAAPGRGVFVSRSGRGERSIVSRYSVATAARL